jgi:tripartite-type tricarboxylate transporter receptor subunit TctC
MSDHRREASFIDTRLRARGKPSVRCFASGRSLFIAALLTAWLSPAASAESVEDFYRNRNVSLVIGYNVGGGYDTYARILARYMGKYIPGRPNLIPQNMVGAGSLRAASFLYNVAPKDGSAFGMVSRDMATEPLLGDAKFDSSKFTWLGSITDEVSLCATWHASPVKNWNDVMTKGVTFGASSGGADTDLSAILLRNVFGAKIKLVSGYPGGAAINLAMERTEVEGRCGWSWGSIKSQSADWIRDKKLNLLIQFALEKSPELPDVPLILDLATNDEQRQILRVIMARQLIARPFVAAPGIPEDRKQALRNAFDATMKDPDFRADAAKASLEVNPADGATIEKLLAELYRTPKDVVDKAKLAIHE